MKKLFAFLSLTAFYLIGFSQSTVSPDNPNHFGHANSAVRQYVKQHIMPVLLEKRQLVEKELTTAEKSDLTTYRTTLKQLFTQRKEQMQQKPAGVSMHEYMQSDDQRALAKQNRQQMKQIMQNVQAIANNHLATLDNIHSQLEPSRTQWANDIAKLKANAATQNVNTEKVATDDVAAPGPGANANHFRHGGEAQGMGGKMFEGRQAYAHFLLLPAQPAVTGSANDDVASELESWMAEQAPATGSSALVSFEISPNPASNELITGNGQLPGQNEFKLLDMQGRVAVSLQNIQPAQHIDVSQLPGGTYIAQLTSNGQSQQNKIVISR